MERIIYSGIFLLLLVCSQHVFAAFITPTSATSSNGSSANDPSVLLDGATDAAYYAPAPPSGGNGTSWFYNGHYTTLTFEFAGPVLLEQLYLWDYYGHSPKNWELKLFSGVNGSGEELYSHSFSIATGGNNHLSTRYIIDFMDTENVLSATLANTNRSTRGGVGLAEVHFEGEVAPAAISAPSALAFLSLGLAWFGRNTMKATFLSRQS